MNLQNNDPTQSNSDCALKQIGTHETLSTLASQSRREEFLPPASSVNLFQIKPTYSLSGTNQNSTQQSFLNTVQQIIDSMVPDLLRKEMANSQNPETISSIFYRLNRMLPLFNHSPLDESVSTVSFTHLCPAEYTHGVGRYVVDTLSRWLFPGKQVEISGGISLNFQFVIHPSSKFLLAQEIISVHNKEILYSIQKNLPRLIEEMKINILSVYHARYIASLRSISMDQKNRLIKENLSTLLNYSIDDGNRTLYDQMQGFIEKLSAEEKIDQVKRNISHLTETRPRTFDRDVFYEMTHFTILFSDQFSAKRETRHISRVIAYQYLFKKILQANVQKTPFQRHLSIKVLKTTYNGNEPILAILIGINFLRETERFEIPHLLEAIRTCLPNAVYVEKSLVVDRRHDKIRFFYLEIQKNGPFTSSEIKLLRQKLPNELIRQIENVVHPIFMPRNEEEIIRNLIVLSKQIKYVRDLPQISIHYDKQSEVNLTFTVIIARLLKPGTDPLAKILEKAQESLRIEIDDIRTIGYVKQKYAKETAIFHVTIDKFPFFRPDYSVDLLRARQKIVLKLGQFLGEFRDFNGGMILKQDEALTELRAVLEPLSQEREFLLENYFYSLRPGIMQTIHDSLVLKEHFKLLIQTLESPRAESYRLNTRTVEKFYIGFISAVAPTFKEEVLGAINQLKISSHDLTTSFLQIEETSTFGFLLRMDTLETAQKFETALLQALQGWRLRFSCPLPRIS